MPIPRLRLGQTALLVVDVQERLLPAIHGHEQVLDAVGRLLDGCATLNVPVLATEQYRKGLGATVEAIDRRLGNAICREEKLKFSACIEPVRQCLVERQVRSVIVCGIEAHVCVLQTCLELAEAGFITAVAADAVGSRRHGDRDAAVLRLVQAGILPVTVESALLELVHEAGTDLFRAVLPIIK